MVADDLKAEAGRRPWTDPSATEVKLTKRSVAGTWLNFESIEAHIQLQERDEAKPSKPESK